jgi:hypothetical protein
MAEPYVPRIADAVLERRLKHHAAVLIVGPRATGKTTTAAKVAGSVIRLDRPAEAAVVSADPDAAIRGLTEPVLIDEWQVVPAVLGAVKRAVDGDPRPGRFVLTGSVRGELDTPGWPGTGRLLRISMYGLTVAETLKAVPPVPLLDRLAMEGPGALTSSASDAPDLRGYAELAARGGFPEPVLRLPESERGPWAESYIDQLLSRDVSELAARPDAVRLRRYLEAYAINTAGVVDQRTLNQAAGIAKGTGETYESLLRQLLVVDAVPGWWSNRLKRLIKSPKRYVVDTSIALAAIRGDAAGLMRDGDQLGRMLDTLVMAQLRAELSACETRPRLFHLRQEQGRREADILIEYGAGRVFVFEVKAASAPKRDDARHLIWLRDQLGEQFLGGALLHTGPRAFELDERIIAAPLAALW